MEKFLTTNFLVLLCLTLILFIVHEFGHWLAYRLCGYEAVVRKSVIAPGIDPKESIEVSRIKGLFIALNGFILSTCIVILPAFILEYKLWVCLLIGGLAGASVDFIWAFGMLFRKTIVITGKR